MQTATRESGDLKRIALLHAEGHTPGSRNYMINVLIDIWRGAGIEVVELIGTKIYVPADILIVHVDRSIVPKAYQDFARRYPVAINAGALDIRKRTHADGLLERGSLYAGPVVVKSDLNFGGEPEYHQTWRQRVRFNRIIERFNSLLFPDTIPPIRAKEDYRLYAEFSQVPPEAFRKENVVQKFMPELRDGRFVLREYYFLCDQHYLSIETSDAPIFTDDRLVEIKRWYPLPLLLALREKLGLDYGKIDFVMVDDAPFIFDANKTMGLGNLAIGRTLDEQYAFGHVDYMQMAEAFAAGLVDWYRSREKSSC